jgi:hypothetical protein
MVVFKRVDEPVFNQIAARRAVRAIKRTHVLDGARQTWGLLDARGIDRQFDCKKLVCPSTTFEDFFAPYQRSPLKTDGHARAVATCKIKFLPELRLQYAIFAIADYSAEDFTCKIFNLSLI